MSNHDHHPPILRVAALAKHYSDGKVQALRNVSLAIDRGEYVALMGPSGSGKSTLLNLLGVLDRPTSGEVYFNGRPLSQMRDPARLRAEKIGYVFQSFHLIPTLTAAENVQLPMFEGRLRPRQRARRARELLELVGMGHRADHLPGQLSVGERQRVAIARALANDPLLILADEPTGNLDSHNAAEILDLFARLHREHGVTIVAVTHSPEVAERAERLIRLCDGQVVFDSGGNRRLDESMPAPSAPAGSDRSPLCQLATTA